MEQPRLVSKMVIGDNGNGHFPGIPRPTTTKCQYIPGVTLTSDISRHVDNAKSPESSTRKQHADYSSRTKWTIMTTRQMIAIVKQKRHLFNTQLSNDSVWDIIQEIMCKDKKYYFTANQIRNRFHNLKRLHKKQKDANIAGDGYSAEFPFWNDFEEMFGKSTRLRMPQDKSIDMMDYYGSDDQTHNTSSEFIINDYNIDQEDFEYLDKKSINVQTQKKWSPHATYTLIAIYKEKMELFHTQDHCSVWNMIALEMATDKFNHYYQFTAKQVKHRIMNLKQLYRKEKDEIAKTGAAPSFHFWNEFEELFGSEEKRSITSKRESNNTFPELSEETLISIDDDTADYTTSNPDSHSTDILGTNQTVFVDSQARPKRKLVESSQSSIGELLGSSTSTTQRLLESLQDLDDTLKKLREEAQVRFERSMEMRKAELEERKNIRILMQRLIEKM